MEISKAAQTTQKPEVKKIPRPMPRPNAYMNTGPFWDGCQEKKLLIQQCPKTGKYQFFPRPGSLFSGRRDTVWKEVSGNGIIYSWTNTFSAWPGHEERIPYICAYVELSEGVRILCNIFNCSSTDIYIGMPVKLYWEELENKTFYPAFQPS
ncbi:MAG: OB-fold domain-containing protein [Betaproteobacteria bacterium]